MNGYIKQYLFNYYSVCLAKSKIFESSSFKTLVIDISKDEQRDMVRSVRLDYAEQEYIAFSKLA